MCELEIGILQQGRVKKARILTRERDWKGMRENERS
jgi:hypothetical protein